MRKHFFGDHDRFWVYGFTNGNQNQIELSDITEHGTSLQMLILLITLNYPYHMRCMQLRAKMLSEYLWKFYLVGMLVTGQEFRLLTFSTRVRKKKEN